MPAAVVAGRLAGAYGKLAQLRFRDGLLDLKVSVLHVLSFKDKTQQHKKYDTGSVVLWRQFCLRG